MATVIEKISMLLALAGSSYEEEAKSALLMARKLMAEHKLRPEDIEPQKDKRVVRVSVGIQSTKTSTPWASCLAGTIAPRYCCRHFLMPKSTGRTVEIGLIGFADDVNACKLACRYAHESVLSYCKIIKQDMRGQHTAKEVHQMCNSYGWGFCTGLQAAFEAQTEQHQEWGLVMLVPQEVEEEIAGMKKISYAVPSVKNWNAQFAAKGYRDGTEFQPSRRLEA